MKVLIWSCCILAYSVVMAVLNFGGMSLGWIPVSLLAVLLIFLPAPALCRARGRRQRQTADPMIGAPVPKSVSSILRSRGFLAGCFTVALILSFASGGLVWREVEGQKVWDAAYIVGQNDGYKEGYGVGYEAGISASSDAVYKEGYNDGYLDGKWLYYWEVWFFRNSACIVTTGGEKYHHYGCYHIGDSSYWIYNVELAEAKGYTPCLDCWEAGLSDESPLSLPPLG